jgi:hypothetical protein
MLYYQYSQGYLRNDNSPGYVYLMIAKGYHGIVPGLLLKRCKIGLSRNPEVRAKQIAAFEGSQPPCDILILKTVYVQDMKKIEGKLHKKFKSRNIRLKKSKEWFDLWVWQIYFLKFWMNVLAKFG